jgi:hypothetical protein
LATTSTRPTGSYGRPATAPAKPAGHITPAGATSLHDPHGLEHGTSAWKAIPSDPALSERTLFVQFHDSVAGDVDRLTMNLEPNAGEIVFAKKPPLRLSDPAFLRGLTGVYAMVDNPTVTVTVDLKGTELTAFVPGQPLYDLVPYRGTEFRLKQITGYGIRFVLDENGVVKEALLLQPDAVYTIRRK